jgi:hypothetical protein
VARIVTDRKDDGIFAPGPEPYVPPHLKDGELELIRKRQRARARILALLLGAFVVLLFFITIAKTGINW